MHDGERIKSRSQVVHYNTGAFGQPLQPPNGKRFPHIEDTKEYKAREKGFPNERNSDERHQLTGNFVDDDELWVFQTSAARDQGGGGNSDKGHNRGCDDRRP